MCQEISVTPIKCLLTKQVSEMSERIVIFPVRCNDNCVYCAHCLAGSLMNFPSCHFGGSKTNIDESGKLHGLSLPSAPINALNT